MTYLGIHATIFSNELIIPQALPWGEGRKDGDSGHKIHVKLHRRQLNHCGYTAT